MNVHKKKYVIVKRFEYWSMDKHSYTLKNDKRFSAQSRERTNWKQPETIALTTVIYRSPSGPWI